MHLLAGAVSALLLVHLWLKTGVAPTFRNSFFTSDSPLAINIALLALFFVSHSLFAMKRLRSYLTRKHYVYLTLLFTSFLWFFWHQTPEPQILFVAPLPILFYTVQALGAVGFAWTWSALDVKEFLGSNPRTQHLSSTLQTSAPYALCRHPTYLFTLMMLASPDWTPERALFSGGVLLYVLIGMRLEEKKLTEDFMDYASYAKRTPALVPTLRSFKEAFRKRTVRPRP